MTASKEAWPSPSFAVVGRWRWLRLLTLVIYTVLASCVFYGWPSLSALLFGRGAFLERCAGLPDLRLAGHRYACLAQDAAVNRLFPFTLCCHYLTCAVGGFVYRKLGPKATAVLGQLVHGAGWLGVAAAQTGGTRALAYYASFAAVGAGAGLTFLPSLAVVPLFPRRSSTVITVLGSAASMSYAVPLAMERAWRRVDGGPVLVSSLFAGYALGVCSLCALTAAVVLPARPWADAAPDMASTQSDPARMTPRSPTPPDDTALGLCGGELADTHTEPDMESFGGAGEGSVDSPHGDGGASVGSAHKPANASVGRPDKQEEPSPASSDQRGEGSTRSRDKLGEGSTGSPDRGPHTGNLRAWPSASGILTPSQLMQSRSLLGASGSGLAGASSLLDGSLDNGLGGFTALRGLSSLPPGKPAAPPLDPGPSISLDRASSAPRGALRAALASPEYLYILCYSLIVNWVVIYTILSAEHLYGAAVRDALEWMLPLTFLPCILLGRAMDRFGVLRVCYFINTVGLASFGCYGYAFSAQQTAPQTALVASYAAATLFCAYASIQTSQVLCYVQETFEPRLAEVLIGLSAAVSGASALLLDPIYARAARTDGLDPFVIALTAALFCAYPLLARLQTLQRRRLA